MTFSAIFDDAGVGNDVGIDILCLFCHPRRRGHAEILYICTGIILKPMKSRLSVVTWALIAALCSCTGPKDVRVLYWNIQNGMWADQGNNYDNFVSFVKETEPDICIWCEAKSHYRTGSGESFPNNLDSLYLPSNWNALAARYGHKYVFLGGERDFFPQVISSRYPLEEALRMTGDSTVTVSHGAGWAVVHTPVGDINIVTVHTWPQKYGFDIPKNPPELRKESVARHEGDSARYKEMRWVVENTIGTDEAAKEHFWILAGDMNSVSRVDNSVYGLPEDSTEFLTQDYLMGIDCLADAQHALFDSFVCTASGNNRRIDYIYCTPPLLERIKKFQVVKDGFPSNTKTDIRNFWIPSDHYPIVMDISGNAK